jgi:hypothetical protein
LEQKRNISALLSQFAWSTTGIGEIGVVAAERFASPSLPAADGGIEQVRELRVEQRHIRPRRLGAVGRAGSFCECFAGSRVGRFAMTPIWVESGGEGSRRLASLGTEMTLVCGQGENA